jgi:hypothetical protein
LSAPAVGEGVYVLLPGTQEIQEVRANVLAGLTDAQKNQIVTKAFLRSKSSDNAPERREAFTACSALLLFQGDSVIVEKREQLVLVLFQALLELRRCLTLQVAFGYLLIEPLHRRKVLLQKAAFQAVSIDSFHHGLEQNGKGLRKLFQFFIIGVLQDIVVHVPYQVNQAFLLRTLD